MSHPWDGLSKEDLEPTPGECAELNHPYIGSGRHAPCYCGLYYRGSDGKRWHTPDPSDYEDPPDPRDFL